MSVEPGEQVRCEVKKRFLDPEYSQTKPLAFTLVVSWWLRRGKGTRALRHIKTTRTCLVVENTFVCSGQVGRAAQLYHPRVVRDGSRQQLQVSLRERDESPDDQLVVRPRVPGHHERRRVLTSVVLSPASRVVVPHVLLHPDQTSQQCVCSTNFRAFVLSQGPSRRRRCSTPSPKLSNRACAWSR